MKWNPIETVAEVLSALIQIPTVAATNRYEMGAYREKLTTLFETLFTKAQKIFIGDAMILKIVGTDDVVKPVLICGHMDVVAADENDGWKHPPFSGKIVDGQIWGRGALDMKGAQCALLTALNHLLQEGYQPKHTIYLYLSCDEEIGGNTTALAANWFVQQGISFETVFDEGGTIGESSDGANKKQMMIGMAEKGSAEVRFTATAEGGHAAWPKKNSPLIKLSRLMLEIEEHPLFKRGLTPESRKILKTAASVMPAQERARWEDALLEGNEAKLDALTPDADMLLGATVAFTMLQSGTAFNVQPKKAELTANVRTTAIQSLHEVVAILQHIAAKFDVSCTLISGNDASPVSSMESVGYQSIVDTAKIMFGETVSIVPFTLAGGTDSKHFMQLTNQTIRFCPIYIGKEEGKGVHGVGEFIRVDSLQQAVQFYQTWLHDWI